MFFELFIKTINSHFDQYINCCCGCQLNLKLKNQKTRIRWIKFFFFNFDEGEAAAVAEIDVVVAEEEEEEEVARVELDSEQFLLVAPDKKCVKCRPWWGCWWSIFLQK